MTMKHHAIALEQTPSIEGQLNQCIDQYVMICTSNMNPYGTLLDVNANGGYVVLRTSLYREVYIRLSSIEGVFTRSYQDEPEEDDEENS